VFFHQKPLVFGLQIDAPAGDGVLELLFLIGLGCLKDVDGLGVGEAYKGVLQHKPEFFQQALFGALVFGLLALFFSQTLVQKGQVFGAFFQNVAYNVLGEGLGQVYVGVEVVKGHFRLNHPEFRQVPCGVGVFRSEGGAKGVDLAQCHGAKFSFQLPADR
jgi:hypothetical protein